MARILLEEDYLELQAEISALEKENARLKSALNDSNIATDAIITRLCERNAALERANEGLEKILRDTLAVIPVWAKARL